VLVWAFVDRAQTSPNHPAHAPGVFFALPRGILGVGLQRFRQLSAPPAFFNIYGPLLRHDNNPQVPPVKWGWSNNNASLISA